MGWFGRDKKSGAGEPPQTEAAPAAGVDFDSLRAASASGTEPGALDRLWRAVFGLEQWCFIQRGTLASGAVQPYCGVVDGKPLLFAFTDEQRANAYAHASGLNMPEASGAAGVLSIQRDSAVKMALGMQADGLFGVLFNQGTSPGRDTGFFCPVANLVPMSAVFRGISLAEEAERLGADAAALLHDRYSRTGKQEHLEELVAWVFRRPEWWFLADPERPDRPRAWTGAMDGDLVTGLFTSVERLNDAAQRMKLAGPNGGAPSIRVNVSEGVRKLVEMAAAGEVKMVALNLRVPLPAESFDAFERVYAGT